MNMKRILLVSIILVAILSSVGAVSAGFFDFLGDSGVENQTYAFEGCTLELPEDTVVINATIDEDGVLCESHYITSESSGNEIIFEILSGDVVTNNNDFQANAVSLGAKPKGDYGEWAVLDTDKVEIDGDNSTHVKYVLARCEDSKIFQIEGDDLDALKAVADTFKIK